MRATVDQLHGKYEHLAKEIDEYQGHLVNYLVDSGLVSREALLSDIFTARDEACACRDESCECADRSCACADSAAASAQSAGELLNGSITHGQPACAGLSWRSHITGGASASTG
jgi:hypothetical protein